MFSLTEQNLGEAGGGGGGGGGLRAKKTTGVKIVYFVFVFLFNGSMIMLRGLQVSSFSMLFTCL